MRVDEVVLTELVHEIETVVSGIEVAELVDVVLGIQPGIEKVPLMVPDPP